MAGILGFGGKRESLRYLALPGEQDWELWSFASPAEAHLVKSIPVTELVNLPPDTRIALPSRQMVTLPLWLQTIDPTLFQEMIAVQLEKRGLLKSSNGAPSVYHHVVAKEQERTLLLALVLNPNLPDSYCLDLTGDYDFAARCRPLPTDGYLFWREEGRLVMAVTRNNQLAYLHTFSSSEITTEIAKEIQCLRLRFSWEHIFTEDSFPIHLCGTFTHSERQALQEVLQVTPKLIPLPNPLFRETSLSMTPTGVSSARTQQEKSKRWKRLVRQLLWIYLLVILGVLGQFGWLTYQASTLRKQVQSQAASVKRLMDISDHWKALQPAVDSTFYPLETLLSCVNQLPPETRLTEFNHSPDNIVIQGEAQNAGIANNFHSNIKSDPNLKKWTWTMPEPRIFPNTNKAQFQLSGTHPHAQIQ